MSASQPSIERIQGYCALCRSRCGSIAVIENGRFAALEPDPSHPTGKALCAKGRAAPELVYHSERLRYPLKRTRPKGDPDPGWQRITWDEALDLTARKIRSLADLHGPESVAFSVVSPSTSAMDDTADWIERLMNAFGSPNLCGAMELCGWGRYLATRYTFGAGVPGDYMPELEQTGCIVYWGYNPNLARLAHATATMEALKRGAHLIVVDPRRTGIAKKADLWLQVRPGTDAALALGITQVMIERDWYDQEFIREWTNGPLMVRADNGQLLRQSDLETGGSQHHYLAWDEALGGPILYDSASGRYDGVNPNPALFGKVTFETLTGEVECWPAFELAYRSCSQYTPERVEAICGVAHGQVEQAARMLWEARPVSYYAWSGVEMQTNATQIARAIGQLYTLTGNLDSPGGNVLFSKVPAAAITGREWISSTWRAKPLGAAERPLGPSIIGHVTSDELYRAILDGQPYPVRGLVDFGSNLLLSHSDSLRGREALRALDFYVHADLFMNPTAEQADIVLPVSSAFEREALKIGFESSQEAQSLVQLRQPVAAPPGEARSDTEIVFDLAVRLGLGEYFWGGDIDAGYRYQLAPSGLTLDALRRQPGGIKLPIHSRYRKYAERVEGVPQGFNTPTKKIELYSEILLAHGYPPLPQYEEPLVGPRTRPDLVGRYPLILTCTKNTLFLETQGRALPSLRKRVMDPEVELHPQAAAARGIQAGEWVEIETPNGRVRARAVLNDSLQPEVVCGQHGWWQACSELDAPGYDPFGPEGANFNLLIGADAIDPVSGSVPHRAYLCQVRKVD